MQDLLANLLWRSVEIDEAADRLRRTLPGFQEAERAYEELADQLQKAAGFSLYDQYFTRLTRYTNYEVQAYYALGLGLREDITKALGV